MAKSNYAQELVEDAVKAGPRLQAKKEELVQWAATTASTARAARLAAGPDHPDFARMGTVLKQANALLKALGAPASR